MRIELRILLVIAISMLPLGFIVDQFLGSYFFDDNRGDFPQSSQSTPALNVENEYNLNEFQTQKIAALDYAIEHPNPLFPLPAVATSSRNFQQVDLGTTSEFDIVGIISQGEIYKAVFRNTESGAFKTTSVGDTIENREIIDITSQAVRVKHNDTGEIITFNIQFE